MSKSKKVELQVTVQSQDQWEELLQKDGLLVVDAYSEWCGPCKAAVSTLKRIKNEMGDSLLHFAIAKTDNIDSLSLYRGKSQPTFLFYANGTLVHVIRGCNCPVIIKTINNQLEKEHKVLEGKAERTEYIDKEVGAQQQTEEKDEQKDLDEDDEEIAARMTESMMRMKNRISFRGLDDVVETEVPKEVSLAIIKPDAVKAGLVDEIIAKVEAEGMEILRQEERTLTKEEAAEFYKQHEGSEHFQKLVEFMCSGPCLTLIISKGGTGDGVIPHFRDLIGPKDVNVAKEEAPTSIRALYGTSSVMNAIHACDTSESAARELAFFFPDFVSPAVKTKRRRSSSQRTLALIRPEALRQHKDSILAKINESGFSIAMAKELTLSREEAEDFYDEHKGKDFFESLVSNMCSGPVMALCLAKEDAVEGWRQMLGPKEVEVAAQEAPDSLRAQFKVEDSDMNPLHGSDSQTAAAKEIEKIFPIQTTVAVIKPETAAQSGDAIINKIKESGFRIISRKNVGLSKELATQFYHEHDGKDFFNGLTDYMSSGESTVLLLEREDAVSGWRALMGPTDPDEAREKAPDSIRAMYGKDILKNAVHGSSNMEKAGKVIEELFPDVELLPSGRTTVCTNSKEDLRSESKDERKLSEEPNEDGGEKDGVVTEEGQKTEKDGQIAENDGQEIERKDLQGEETTAVDNSEIKDGAAGDVTPKQDGNGEENNTVVNDGGNTVDGTTESGGAITADNNTAVATGDGANDSATGSSAGGGEANDATDGKANNTTGGEANDGTTDSKTDNTAVTSGDGTTSNDTSGSTASETKPGDAGEGVNTSSTIDGDLPKGGNTSASNSGDQGDGSADGAAKNDDVKDGDAKDDVKDDVVKDGDAKDGAAKDGDKSVAAVTDTDESNGTKDNTTAIPAEKTSSDTGIKEESG